MQIYLTESDARRLAKELIDDQYYDSLANILTILGLPAKSITLNDTYHRRPLSAFEIEPTGESETLKLLKLINQTRYINLIELGIRYIKDDH